MRPAPLLLALLLAWAALGGLVLGGFLPRWSWALAALAIAVPALMDLWRQSRRPSPKLQRELPEALALGVRREAALRVQAEQSMTVQVFDCARRLAAGSAAAAREPAGRYGVHPALPPAAAAAWALPLRGCTCACARRGACGGSNARCRRRWRCGSIRTSCRSPASHCSVPTRPRGWSVRTSSAAVAKAPTSTRCASTASATACASWTGRPPHVRAS